MLTIRKHPLSLKAATLGTIAFVIGLGGAAMYMERFQQHENLVFGREETVLGASDARSAEQKSPANETQNATSTQQTGSPQTAEGSVSSTPVASTGSGAAATQAPATASPTPAPGMGGGSGSTGTPPPSGSGGTEPASELPLVPCLLQNCVMTTLQNTTNGLLNP